MEQRPRWMQLLDTAHNVADHQNEVLKRSKDTSWFLTDASGNQLWRRDYSENSVGRNYAFRDYFNGLGTSYTRESAPDDLEPIQEGHVSLAYKSEVTNQNMVALSVPVKSSDDVVIAVLAATLHLGDLQSRLGQDISGTQKDTVDHIVALADRRKSQLLDHPWLQSEVLQQMTDDEADEMFRNLKIDPAIEEHVRSASERYITIDEYHDPIGQLESTSAQRFDLDWIAAVSTMKNEKMPWLVIVQEDKTRTLAPVAVMARRATEQAWIAVLASLSVMAAVWLFVWYALVRTTDAPLKTPAAKPTGPDHESA